MLLVFTLYDFLEYFCMLRYSRRCEHWGRVYTCLGYDHSRDTRTTISKSFPLEHTFHGRAIYQKRIAETFPSHKYKVRKPSVLLQRSPKRNISQQPGNITRVSHASCTYPARRPKTAVAGSLNDTLRRRVQSVFLNFLTSKYIQNSLLLSSNNSASFLTNKLFFRPQCLLKLFEFKFKVNDSNYKYKILQMGWLDDSIQAAIHPPLFCLPFKKHTVSHKTLHSHYQTISTRITILRIRLVIWINLFVLFLDLFILYLSSGTGGGWSNLWLKLNSLNSFKFFIFEFNYISLFK